jgi:hypothetical protein
LRNDLMIYSRNVVCGSGNQCGIFFKREYKRKRSRI